MFSSQAICTIGLFVSFTVEKWLKSTMEEMNQFYQDTESILQPLKLTLACKKFREFKMIVKKMHLDSQ